MSPVTKVRRTVTLDPAVAAAFDGDSAGFSATVNTILRREVERRQRQAALAAFVDDLDARFGPPDQLAVERFERALA